jgi:hypothetical protein
MSALARRPEPGGCAMSGAAWLVGVCPMTSIGDDGHCVRECLFRPRVPHFERSVSLRSARVPWRHCLQNPAFAIGRREFPATTESPDTRTACVGVYVSKPKNFLKESSRLAVPAHVRNPGTDTILIPARSALGVATSSTSEIVRPCTAKLPPRQPRSRRLLQLNASASSLGPCFARPLDASKLLLLTLVEAGQGGTLPRAARSGRDANRARS